MKYKILILTCLSFAFLQEEYQNGNFTISRIHYGGGGDWYADPSSLQNLLEYISNKTTIKANPKELNVKIGDENFNSNNYFYITGHGNIKLTSEETMLLRRKLINEFTRISNKGLLILDHAPKENFKVQLEQNTRCNIFCDYSDLFSSMSGGELYMMKSSESFAYFWKKV